MLRALMASDVQDIPVALLGHHARRRTVVLEDRVGGNRGAVQPVINGPRKRLKRSYSSRTPVMTL